jgi:cobalt-zinc-cadmium efflux system protein
MACNHTHENHKHDEHGHCDLPAFAHVHAAQDKLKIAVALAIMILAVEVTGGIFANSLALLSDAGHMLTDVASLVVALLAVRICTNPPSKSMTYGYQRSTILAALFNAVVLVGIAIFIGGEAYHRILNPQPVHGVVLLVTATIGVVLNLYIGLGMRGEADNINIKSAMLHVLGDAAASGGVIVAGIVIYFTKWYIVDPIISILIALLVAVGAWKIIRETYVVLMEGTPERIEFEEVAEAIQSVPGIIDIHDLHIWSLTTNHNAMSGHIVVDGKLTVSATQAIIRQIEDLLDRKFRIGHASIQVEDDGHPHTNGLLCSHI